MPEPGTDPREVLLAEIARTQAAVEWLAGQVAALDTDALIKGTRYVRTTTTEDGKRKTVAEAGTARHELLALYMEERHHLRGLCRDALRVDLEEDDGVSALDELAARRAADRRPDAASS